MPKVGMKEFDYTPEGIAEAESYSEATGIPMSNAQERSQIYREGGKVEKYKKGGKVDITDIVKTVEKKVAQEKRHDKWIKEADKKGETLQSGPDTIPRADMIKHSKKGHKALKEQQIKKMAKSIRKQKKEKKEK